MTNGLNVCSSSKLHIARYIMIGGFLGSGKTTAVSYLAHAFSQKGLKVGLITNDQGSGLIDTASLRARGFATEEIAGGCFCCRFHSLTEAAKRLKDALHPDIFLAEPVGSCTDLIATVSYPLRRMYGESFALAPLSVLVDPLRARRILGLEAGGSFSKKVIYIYRKQLEEADLIVINKIDLIDANALSELRAALCDRFSQARILCISAKNGKGLKDWIDIIQNESQSIHATMNLDYESYADGEARLGWLNASIHVKSENAFDGNALLYKIAESLQKDLTQLGFEIAHLKMTLTPNEALRDWAIVNVVHNDRIAELGQRLDGEIEAGELIVNLRAEANPEVLETILRKGLDKIQAASMTFRVEDLERFRPAKPKPTYREG